MLAVVHNQQDFSGLEVEEERIHERSAWCSPDAKDGGDRLGNEVRIRQRSQFHKPDAVLEIFRHRRGGREGEAGLARAAGTG
jgi:hypothetical protein